MRRRSAIALITMAMSVAGCASSASAHAPVTEASRPAMVPVDDDVLRARVAVANLLQAMNARDITELEARYAIRARTPDVSALARMLDRGTGPSELRVHLVEDPTVSGDLSHPTLQFLIEMRWTTAAGQSRTQRLAMQARTLRENGQFLIASVRPPADFAW